MANSYSQAHRLPDDMDWSIPHRAPPPVPNNPQQTNQYAYFPSPPNNHYVASAITTDEPEFAPDGLRTAYREGESHRTPAARQDHSRSNNYYSSAVPHTAAGAALRDTIQDIGNGQRPPNNPYNAPNPSQTYHGGKRSISRDQSNERPATSASTAAAAAGGGGGGRRRGSFSFLRRNSSNQAHPSAHGNSNDPPAVYTSNTAPPPLPVTRIAQAHADAAADPNNRHFRSPSESTNTSRRKSSSEGRRNISPNMLRKSSRMRAQQQAEQERLAREAAQLPRQPPHLPSLSPLPGIATFGGEEPRPDANTIDSDAHAHTVPAPPRAANFSRPSAMSTSSYQNSHPSPNYAIRSGNVPSSSPDVRSASSGEYVSIDSRSESVTNRGRYSYSSTTVPVNSVTSPRRVRRRKDPTPFNVLVIGAKNSGKTSFISFLRHSLALPSPKQSPSPQEPRQAPDHKSSFTPHYLETEIDGERVGLTLWDSKGLESGIVDLQVREMAAFVESKFEETFVEEQKVMRSPGVRDTHIHCVLLILDPVRLDSGIASGTLPASLDDDLDFSAIRALWGKTTVIPVISKADTLTINHMASLKRAVWTSLKSARLDPLEALELEDDPDSPTPDDHPEPDSPLLFHTPPTPDHDHHHHADPSSSSPTKPKKPSHKRHSSLSLNGILRPDDETPYIPMSILSPDPHDLGPISPSAPTTTTTTIGRRFPWGVASPLDPEHCDFVRLRDSVFAEWRAELRELSRARWYEHWRTSRLEHLPPKPTQRVRGGVTPVGAVPRGGFVVGGGGGGGGGGGATGEKEQRAGGGARSLGSPPPPIGQHPAMTTPRSVVGNAAGGQGKGMAGIAEGYGRQGVGLAVTMGER